MCHGDAGPILSRIGLGAPLPCVGAWGWIVSLPPSIGAQSDVLASYTVCMEIALLCQLYKSIIQQIKLKVVLVIKVLCTYLRATIFP